jgi:hypothetical protein
MGKIVASMATMHAPQLFTRAPEEDPKQLDAGIEAMKKLGETLDETKPDALIIFASDHLETFFLHSVPTFAIVAGERATASFGDADGRHAFIRIWLRVCSTSWCGAASTWCIRRMPSSGILSLRHLSGCWGGGTYR